jgi:hypothetical protein
MSIPEILFLFVAAAVTYLMVFAALGKDALELKRAPRCPSCGRLLRDCSCR